MCCVSWLTDHFFPLVQFQQQIGTLDIVTFATIALSMTQTCSKGSISQTTSLHGNDSLTDRSNFTEKLTQDFRNDTYYTKVHRPFSPTEYHTQLILSHIATISTIY